MGFLQRIQYPHHHLKHHHHEEGAIDSMRKAIESPLGNVLIFETFTAAIVLFFDSETVIRCMIYGYTLGITISIVFVIAKQLHLSMVCSAVFYISLVLIGGTFIFRRLIPGYWNFLLGLWLAFASSIIAASWHKRRWIEWGDLYKC